MFAHKTLEMVQQEVGRASTGVAGAGHLHAEFGSSGIDGVFTVHNATIVSPSN